MHGFDLIATIAGGFTAALVLGYITQRIGLSPPSSPPGRRWSALWR